MQRRLAGADVRRAQASLATCPVSVTRRSVRPECTRSPSIIGVGVVDVAVRLQRVQDVLQRLLGVLGLGVDPQLGVLRRLVRVVDAGEPGDLAGERLLVQALRVAVLGDLRRPSRARAPRRSRRSARGRRPGSPCTARSGSRSSPRRCGSAGSATNAIRRMFVSRSSLENPRPFDRFLRTSSPSRISVFRPRACSSWYSISAIVDFPEPERPVNHTVNPFVALRHRKLLPTTPSGASMSYSLRMDGPTSTRFMPST